MGDVISTNLDEGKREMITARTSTVMAEFGRFYEQQYAVALFNSVRYEIEGGGNTQTQLLHRKDPLKNKSIFSGSLFQYLEESKKWRSRFLYVGDSYNISLYESKAAHDRGLHSKGVINCAGYRALTSMEEYLGLLNNSLGDTKAKSASAPFLKCPTQFPLILWHPYARHHYFCVMTEKEQKKWHAVFQDCVRHSNNVLVLLAQMGNAPVNGTITQMDNAVHTFEQLVHQSLDGHSTEDLCKTIQRCQDRVLKKYDYDSSTVRKKFFREALLQIIIPYMLKQLSPSCSPILANLVMETLHPELKNLIVPRLKGKLQQRQRDWMLISDAVYRQVLSQTKTQHEALAQVCEVERPRLDSALRTDMDQIITSKEHVSAKIRALVLPCIEQLVRSKVQPYIHSILEALMEPTSRGFSEVRDILFSELVEVSKNTMNDSSREKLGEHMDKISMLAFHPVKMQSCYEKMEALNLEGLQQRCDVSSPSVFIQRAQILMRQQMDNAVHTFEQLVHQSLDGHSAEDLCKTIQRCQDRVLKKYDHDSSTVRKKFFREALLQIIIPYMLKQLSPSCSPDLPKFKELIFEDFSRFILVENIFEEAVLQSVSKDIMMAVKEAAVQRRHNLYRDSMVLTNSDLNLHLLGEDTIDWAGQFGGVKGEKQGGEMANRKRKQIVSMIHLDGIPLPYESCQEIPGVDCIPEEYEGQAGQDLESKKPVNPVQHVPIEKEPGSPDGVNEIRDLINPVLEVVEKDSSQLTNGMLSLEEGDEVKHITTVTDMVPRESPKKVDRESTQIERSLEEQQCVSAIESAIQQIEIAIQEDPGDHLSECAIDSDGEFAQTSINSSPLHHDDSGFQSPANENVEEVEPQPDTGDEVVDTEQVMLTLVEGVKTSIDLDAKAPCDASEKKSEIETTADRCLL
ncbi:niban-like protein 1 [Sinocyclocheilus grahami]|uniref:niban-like protein 1 n=1 Tax=Sinocyclocheilus grahami TaxID=75366 RepID=UPI0007AC7808|nr:PREDICTED: niban-like protein 1 [Sinocyclocheilus grahami]